MIQNAYYSQTPYSLNILSYIQATLFASNRSRARVLRRALPVYTSYLVCFQCPGTTKERKGKLYARKQGWETHTKPLPSLTLIGAWNANTYWLRFFTPIGGTVFKLFLLICLSSCLFGLEKPSSGWFLLFVLNR